MGPPQFITANTCERVTGRAERENLTPMNTEKMMFLLIGQAQAVLNPAFRAFSRFQSLGGLRPTIGNMINTDKGN
jgi:hypothetical protein